MSDIRMQSIFLDEEFVFEHKADIKHQNDAREISDKLSGYHDPRDRHAKKEADALRKGERGDYASSAAKDGRSVTKKHVDKVQNAHDSEIRNFNGRMYQSQKKNRKEVGHAIAKVVAKSRNESTIMDMIEII